MITSVIFIASLLFLLRRFKSRRSRIIIGLLYSLFVVWYVQAILNYGKYTLQSGQSVELRVSPNTDQLEYNSELIECLFLIATGKGNRKGNTYIDYFFHTSKN